MFNKCNTSTILLLLFFAFTANAMEETKNYVAPNELSKEEWNEINGEIRIYNSCLKQEMFKWVEGGTDPRVVSNQVLEVCSFHLIELQNHMNDKNLDPGFNSKFIYANKNKAARKMLGAIMMLMAQQEQIREANSKTTAEQKESSTPTQE